MKEPLLLAQRDPRARSVSTRVTRCEPVPVGAPRVCDANDATKKADKRKKSNKKKEKEEEKQEEGELFDVELEETVLFAEGGGQPSDRGTISADGVSFRVLHVRRSKEGSAVHRVRGERAVPAGSEAEVRLEWARRHDHMQQHTAQHLLSALAARMHGWGTASWWLAAHGDCHIEFDTPEAPEAELRALEEAANEAIRGAAPVRAVAGAEAAAALSGAGELARGARPDAAGVDENLRAVCIDGHDVNLCCGTHVSSTAELQVVRLTGAQPSRGRTKVFFAAGRRVADAYDSMLAGTRALSALLSAAPPDHARIVARALEDSRAASKSARRAWELVAAADAERLAAEAGGARNIALVRDDPGYPVAAAADALAPLLAAGQVAFLACGEPQGGAGQFVVIGNDDAAVATLGKAACEALGGRGGGRKGRFQGKAPALAGRAVAEVRSLLGLE